MSKRIRIYRHSAYGVQTSGLEFARVFTVRFAHEVGGAATFSAEVLRPTAGVLDGPRFATLVINDEPIATGEILGYPIALAGEVQTIEIVCRHPMHSERVDALFASIPVSDRLEDPETPRRSEEYVAADVYHPPLTGVPELVRIGGERDSPIEILGKGFAVRPHKLLALRLEPKHSPITKLVTTVSSTHTQSRTKLLNIGSVIGEQDTLTPDEYRSAIESIQANGENVEILHAKLPERLVIDPPSVSVTVRRPRLDPVTQLAVGRKDVLLEGAAFNDPDMPALFTASVARREDLKLTVTAGILPTYGGAKSETDQVSLVNPELSIEAKGTFLKGSINGRPGYNREITETRASFWRDAEEEAGLVIKNLVDRAAAKLLRAAHCIRADVTVPAKTARLLTLKDRVTVRDSRLEKGALTGQVVGIEWTEGEGAGEARIELSCPCGTGGEYETPQELVINGGVATNNVLNLVENGNVSELVDDFRMAGTWDEQIEIIDQINAKNRIQKPKNETRFESEMIVAVRDYLPKPSINISFKPLSSSEPLLSSFSAAHTVPVPRGI